ncbi:MAG TPA: hypothetical protein VJK08_02780, partial [Patescibacteria group bacterium]|nr:hypothetical protein [Patescibacteria group bacterium]
MKKQARLTLWLLVIVFAVLVSGWLVWRNTISADTMNGPTILPIGAKTVEVGNVMIPVYVADRLEKTPDKAQLWVNWGDGTAASNVVPANTAPLTTVSFGQFAYVARIGHSYQNVGTYRLTLIPISSNGRRGQMVSVSITLTIGNNYNHSLDWLPSVNKISDGFVVGTNKAFNFQVNVHDKDGMNQSTLTSAIIMDWGDGTTTAPTSVVQGGTAGRDYTIRFENKQYARTLAYRPTLVIKEVNGAGVTKTVREQYVIVASEYQHAPYVNLDIT